MTWTKTIAVCLVLVACTEQLIEAITGRGDPTSGDRARRKPSPRPLPPLDRRRMTEALREAAAEARADGQTITTTALLDRVRASA